MKPTIDTHGRVVLGDRVMTWQAAQRLARELTIVSQDNHMRLVAEAMRAVEWVDSGDYGPGDEDEPIRACLAKGAELARAVKMAEQAMETLRVTIERAKEEK